MMKPVTFRNPRLIRNPISKSHFEKNNWWFTVGDETCDISKSQINQKPYFEIPFRTIDGSHFAVGDETCDISKEQLVMKPDLWKE